MSQLCATDDTEDADDIQTDDGGNMPWSSFNEYFTFDKEKDAKNFLSKCKLCLSSKAPLSCAYSSNANLRKHLKVSIR